jgi:hypothetical protein
VVTDDFRTESGRDDERGGSHVLSPKNYKDSDLEREDDE